MRSAIILLACTSVAAAQNPQARVLFPREGGDFYGAFFVQTTDFVYSPDLANNPVEEFANGLDADGNPIEFGEGHLHGWVFEVDQFGRQRDQVRFYGAGGARFFGGSEYGFYIKEETELPAGDYRAYFQLQANDHTAAQQLAAPSFPGITSVDFTVRDRGVASVPEPSSLLLSFAFLSLLLVRKSYGCYRYDPTRK